MSKGIIFHKLDGSKLKIGIAVARWNEAISFSLLKKCLEALGEVGVPTKNIFVTEVPGAYETVYAAADLIAKKKVDAVICLGCLVKGETMHFEYIAEAVTQGIMKLNLATGTPVVFGILTCLTEAQALARSGESKGNHGYAWGLTAVEMGLLKKKKAKN